MYEFLKGHVIEVTVDHAIIETHGIGYKLLIPISIFGKIVPSKQEICFYTSFVVREQSQLLYGFLEREQRDLFEKLIGLSGVGPKTALNLIGHLSISALQTAVDSADISTLSKVPGIGKKTAERLIVELKNKLSSFSAVSHVDKGPRPPKTVQDAVSALLNLGYNEAAAEKAIKQAMSSLSPDCDLSTLLSVALKNRMQH